MNIGSLINKSSKEKIAKPSEKKKWQPLNIALGTLVAALVYFFCRPVYWADASVVVYVRLIPVIALILTRRNNLFSFFILLLIGLTTISFPTLDGFFVLGLAIYMFVSSILRIFKVQKHMLIGLAVSLIIGLGFYWDHVHAFVAESSLDITKKINSGVYIELGDSTGAALTAFSFNQMITPRQRGLEVGKSHAYRVLDKSGNVVIPLDKWQVFKSGTKDKTYRYGKITEWFNFKNVALRGTFNFSVWLPLDIGDYTIQLVKIEKPVGTIIAEKSFSIVPYSAETLSNITAYLLVEGDPNKYYDSYTKKGKDSVTVNVQSSKGDVVSGKIKSYMTTLEGKMQENSWIGVTENTFSTNPDGEPIALGGMGGNPAIGIYNYEIIINNKVMFHLKYICSPE
jgi:hypothetical protein